MKPIVLVSCFFVNCFFCNSFLLACNRGAYRFVNMDDNARKAFILFCFAASSSLISNLQIVYTNFHSDGDMNFLNYLIWCALMECNRPRASGHFVHPSRPKQTPIYFWRNCCYMKHKPCQTRWLRGFRDHLTSVIWSNFTISYPITSQANFPSE